MLIRWGFFCCIVFSQWNENKTQKTFSLIDCAWQILLSYEWCYLELPTDCLLTDCWLPADCLPNLDKRQHSITMINSTALLGKGLNGLENNNNFYWRLPVAVRSLKSAVLTRFLYSMYLQSFFLLFYLHKKTNLKLQFQILVNPRKIRRKKEGSYLEMGKIQISKW